MSDDKPARYSADANLEPEREHDAHELEEATTERAEEAPIVVVDGDECETWYLADTEPPDGITIAGLEDLVFDPPKGPYEASVTLYLDKGQTDALFQVLTGRLPRP